ncbi:MAG: restriction endonuclease subunit S [Bacteroidaceae bacterium]|nr:restriction endonuclease subunit S [Bacteroidaceae bacterium]
MKEGWKYMKLGEIVVFDKRFKGVPKEQQKQIVSFKHVSAETLKGLLVDNGDVKLLATGLFTGYTTQELAGNNLNSGEVISFPTGGNANIKYHKGNFVDSGNILCVAKDDSIYLKYVHFGLLYQNDYIESCYKGTGIHHPFMPDIWDVKVPIPDISTQYSIVARLDAEFAKIEALKANAEKQLQAAKDLFQAALKELLTPKEGWVEKKLGELGTTKIGPFGSLLHKKDYVVGGIPLINPMHICDNRIKADMSYSVCKEKAEELSAYIMKQGDIVIGRRGEMGRCAVVTTNNDGYLCGTGSIFFRAKKESVNVVFLQKIIASSEIKQKLEKIAGGTTMLNLSSKGFNSLTIKVPSLSEQQRIADRLDALSANVKALQTNYTETITHCNDLKQSLLKKVFE